MAVAESNVLRLQKRLGLSTTIGGSAEALTSAIAIVKKQVLMTLEDDGQCFTQDVKTWIRENGLGVADAGVLLTPCPASNNKAARERWAYCLLLCLAACTVQGARKVADLLDSSSDYQGIQRTACEIGRTKINGWNRELFVQRLTSALNLLKDPDQENGNDDRDEQPDLSAALSTTNGRHCITFNNGTEVRLFQKQYLLLKSLVCANGEPLSEESLRRKRLAYPSDTKRDLVKKLQKAGITAEVISSSRRGYSLKIPITE
jgi:hypothetical protein